MRNIFSISAMIIMCLCSLLSGCGVPQPTATTGAASGASPLLDIHNETWTFMSHDYHRLLGICADAPVFIKYLQDKDYNEILNELNETSSGLSEEERITLHDKLIADATKATTSDNELLRTENIEVVLPQTYSNLTLPLQKTFVGNGSIIVPQASTGLAAIKTPDGKMIVVSSDEGVWTISTAHLALQKITPDTYNGKTYADMFQETKKIFGMPQAFWSGPVSISPDSTKIAYTSNKNNYSWFSVFTSDIDEKKEMMLKADEGYHYSVYGWIDDNTVLCYKYNDENVYVVAITLDGKETILDLDIDSRTIFAMENGLISYVKSEQSEICVVRYTGTSTPELITSLKLDGTVRLQGGDLFSPDTSQLAFIFVPDKEPLSRYLKILDLKSGKVTENNSFPASCGSSAGIQDFSWLNNDSLLTIISEKEESNVTYSTWVYSLNRDGNH